MEIKEQPQNSGDGSQKASAQRSWPRRWGQRLAGLGLIWLVIYYGLPWCLPWPQALNSPPEVGTEVLDRTGRSLRRLLADGKRLSEWAKLEEIPLSLREATLAAEDKRFWSHGGIDFLGVLRAARDAVGRGRAVSGASTITQQLVKLAHPRPRTLWTKVVEMLTARRLEMTWSKERILEEYLNRLDYGNLRRGCRAAGAGYFDKPLADCSLAECAMLAGLPQAPSRLNPYQHLDRAKKRQEWVLSRMEETGRASADAVMRAKGEALQLRRNFGEFAAPHFVDLVLERRGEKALGGPVRTTLDLSVQEFCERMLALRLMRLQAHNVQQGAVVVIDNRTGGIMALVGSRDYADSNSGQVNGATARRSPGSALKPFTYLLALQQGDHPATMIPDLPVEFMTPTGIYKPKNYSGRAYGPVSYRAALANSLNLAAVRVLDKVGGAQTLIDALAACGVTTLTRPAADYGLGLTIGGGEVRLLELTNAYACLGRLGRFLPWQVESQAEAEEGAGPQVFDPEACWLLADVLADNDARVRSFGSQSPLRLNFPVAVKTGTSTDYRDNWTVGFTREYTVGVWVGNFDNSAMQGVSGVTGAGPIFRDIFTYLDTRQRQSWPARPSSLVEVRVDSLTGLPVPKEWLGRRTAVLEKFRAEAAPREPELDRYDHEGRVLLPPLYAQWLAGPDNWLGNDAAVAPAGHRISEENAGLRILCPLPGATFLLDPDLPGNGQRLPLRTNRNFGGVLWKSPTLAIREEEGKVYAQLLEGRHELEVTDPVSGVSRKTWVVVKRL